MLDPSTRQFIGSAIESEAVGYEQAKKHIQSHCNLDLGGAKPMDLSLLSSDPWIDYLEKDKSPDTGTDSNTAAETGTVALAAVGEGEAVTEEEHENMLD